MKTIHPMTDRVLLRPIPQLQSDTIIIPDDATEPTIIRAKVIGLGPRKDGKPWPFEIGAIVYTTDHMGAEVMLDRAMVVDLPSFQQRHLIMREKDILAYVEQ